MRYFMFLVVIAMCLAARALLAHGAPLSNDLGIEAVAPAADTAPGVAISADGSLSVGGVPIATIVSDLAKFKAAAKAHDRAAILMWVAALLAIGIKFGVDWLKGLKNEQLSDNAKRALPWIVTAGGLLVAILARYGAGETWQNAILIGGGAGPGAIAAHELLDGLKKIAAKLLFKAPAAPVAVPAPPAAGGKSARRPLRLIAALITAGAGASGCVPGAGAIYGKNFAACGIGKLPSVAGSIAPVVSDALQHDPAWQSALAGLGVVVGEDAVTCAVLAAVATWSASARHAALDPATARGLTNGRAWLAARGIVAQ